jgi:hypothetical protein
MVAKIRINFAFQLITQKDEKNYFYYGSLHRPGKSDGEIIFCKGMEGDRNDASS